MKDPEIASKISGKNHAHYDHKVYVWKNIYTQEIVNMTRHELYTTYNLDKNHVGRVALKKPGFKSVKGWTLVK